MQETITDQPHVPDQPQQPNLPKDVRYKVTLADRSGNVVSEKDKERRNGVLIFSRNLHEKRSIEEPKQDEHDKVIAFLYFANQTANSLTVVHTGILNRFNFLLFLPKNDLKNPLKAGDNEAEALELSKKNDAAWKYKHGDKLENRLTIKKGEIDWEVFFAENSPYRGRDFLKLVQELYENDGEFNRKVLDAANYGVTLLKQEAAAPDRKPPVILDATLAMAQSLKYVLEECAVVFCLRYIGLYNCIYYFGSRLNLPTEHVAIKDFSEDDKSFSAIFQDKSDLKNIIYKVNGHQLSPVLYSRFDPLLLQAQATEQESATLPASSQQREQGARGKKSADHRKGAASTDGAGKEEHGTGRKKSDARDIKKTKVNHEGVSTEPDSSDNSSNSSSPGSSPQSSLSDDPEYKVFAAITNSSIPLEEKRVLLSGVLRDAKQQQHQHKSTSPEREHNKQNGVHQDATNYGKKTSPRPRQNPLAMPAATPTPGTKGTGAGVSLKDAGVYAPGIFSQPNSIGASLAYNGDSMAASSSSSPSTFEQQQSTRGVPTQIGAACDNPLSPVDTTKFGLSP